MAKTYTSKYPTIVTDTRTNSANESMIKKITVEEYYDLKHHTHSLSDLATEEGDMTFNTMQTLVTEMSQTLNSMNDIINQQNNTIKQQNDIIQKLEADTTELEKVVKTQTETIVEIRKEMAHMTTVSDWDVTKPGTQDIEGNDVNEELGELMGFKMTELI